MSWALLCWVLAMAAGACWNRVMVGGWTGVTLVVWAAGAGPWAWTPAGAFEGIMLGLGPWLLWAQRERHERRIHRLQAKEASRLGRLQQRSRTLRELEGAAQQVESEIARITELYHVTKEAGRALRMEDLAAAVAECVPPLLQTRRARLIVAPAGGGAPTAWRVADGSHGELQPWERSVLERAAQAPAVGQSAAVEFGEAAPSDIATVAWAPLSAEQGVIGMLVVDDLPADRLETLAIVANQLALQVARVLFYEAVESLAVTDSLTGLFVRRYFNEFAAEELRRCAHHRLPCAILMVDLDHFKAKNDTYGHLVGDVVLRETAQLLRQNIRGMDLVARYGGEEFICLLVESGPPRAMGAAERLREVVEMHSIRAYDEVLRQTISIGVACFPDDAATLQELIAHADAALYAAKRAGRNRVVQWKRPS
ncbi:MAG: diguanylate cyclase [Candidatus Omnitrophica bacterium]|nr:diguanylate cyclase [Candidatus Omnitrophota bacterium]